MKLRRLASLLLLAAAFATASCINDILDDEWSGGTTTTLTIETELPELGGATRADVDADDSAKGGVLNIDWSKYNLRIKARAYDTKDNTKYDEVIEYWESADDIGTIEIPMLVTNGRMYDIYVWADIVLADNHSDLHYNTENLPTVTYTEGDGPAINDETYDAFFGYGRASTTSMGATWHIPFSLQRAVSKLRIVAEDSDNSATSATVAIEGILYSGIKFGGNISYSGEMNATEDSGDIISYNRDTADATTMITAYLLTPEEANYTITATLYAGSSEINSISVPNVPLKRGHLTTLCGSMFSSGEVWDGSIEVPTQFDGEWMVINTPGELLWLATAAEAPTVNGTTYSKFRLGKDIDVTNSPEAIQSLRIGNGATFDGNGKTIKGFGAATSALFGSVSGITVTNLTIEGYNATAATHIGVLVNELTGSSTFTNITVKNSSAVTTNGAAGGMVGYIHRATETNRALSYSVTFNNCHVNGVTVNGSLDEGHFVGYFSGYDSNEQLTFDASCSVTSSTVDAPTLYVAANQSCWLPTISDTRYNGMLGGSKYLRGRVTFGTTQFAPKWDGTTTVEPMLANATYDSGTTAGSNRFVVYTPFDLAGVRAKTASPAAIYIRSDVDMNGQGEDGEYNVPTNFTQSAHSSTDDNNFNPFSYVTTLDGKKSDTENYSIHNLAIEQIEQERAAVILYASGTTVHQNINFKGCQTVAVHKHVSTDAKAYGAIVVSNVDATYTMQNVHAYDCRVFALQKIGTLGARISGTSTITNCTVNNCYVENYECNISERFTSGKKTIISWTVEVYADFFPHGEVGGMFGFIQGSSTITNCRVNNTTVHAYGQDDKMATVDGSFVAKLGIAALGYYKVPGRHVSTMIGNIRATGTVTMTNCGVNAASRCTNRHDKHNSTYNYIGQAYIVKFVDSEGSVTVDGKKLTLADCKKNTKL